MKTKNTRLPNAFLFILIVAIAVAGCSSKPSDSEIKEMVLKSALSSDLATSDFMKVREAKVVNGVKDDDRHYTADMEVDWEFVKNFTDYNALQRLTIAMGDYGEFKKGDIGLIQALRVRLVKGDKGWMIDKIVSDKSSKPSVKTSAANPAGNGNGVVAQPKTIAAPQVIAKKEEPFLTVEKFHDLTDASQREAQLFKLMPDFVNDDEKLKIWVSLNSCDAVSKLGNEFEWPGIAKKYKDAYKQIADQIPMTLTLQFQAYLGEYDMETKTFPVLVYPGKKGPFTLSKISVENNAGVCDIGTYIFYKAWQGVDKVNLDKTVSVEFVPVPEDAAKSYVSTHQNIYSRTVALTLDAEVTGAALEQQSNNIYAFSATPKRITIKTMDNEPVVLGVVELN